MSDLERFRSETRAWLEANCPASLRGKGGSELEGVWGGRKSELDGNPDEKLWLERCAERGFTAPTWPREYGGGGLSPEQAKVLARGDAPLQLPPPLIGFGLTMIGPTLLALRERGAEARAPAADLPRRDPLVPGLLRARRRLRPRRPADARGRRRRPLPRERHQGLDLLRRQGRLDLRAGAHRSERQEAGGHHLPADRHGRRRASRCGRSS